jgi:CBS-domain-containing membrane protein
MQNAQRSLSLKTRWLVWRARVSPPALLARFEERKVVSALAAVNAGMAILTIGLVAWLTDLPLVFPALGPSAFILFSAPLSPAGSPRSVILGHLTAMACGYAAWLLVSGASGATVTIGSGTWPPILSAVLALAGCCLVLIRIACPHPPACGSGLVVALGAVTEPTEMLIMALAVVWLTAQAVFMNRLAGLPVPAWRPRRQKP